MKNKGRGFTLIELLIVIAIIGVIAGVGYPSYRAYVINANRAEGKTALLDLAQSMERYFNQNNTYVGATLANTNTPATTENGAYNLQIDNTAATTFQISAVPQGNQATQDTACANLTYNQIGTKGITGTGNVADCW